MISKADPNDPAVGFWKKEIESAVSSGAVRSIREIFKELTDLLSKGSRLLRAPLANPTLPPFIPAPATAATPVVAALATATGTTAPSDWQEEWQDLEPMAGALRAGRLDASAIEQYRRTLSRLSKRHPTQREVWNELLLVVISYQKDARTALKYAKRALEHLPDDTELKRLRDIVGVWLGEQKDE